MHKAMPGILILAAAFMVHGVRTAKKVRKNRTHAGSSVFWLWCERHADTQPSPLLARRGGRDIKRNIAKPPLMERTGWWFIQQIFLILSNHPVSGHEVANASFS